MRRVDRWCVLLLAAGALPAWGQTAFTWNDLGDGRTELRENDKPVLVYNYGPQLAPGAPENRRRCCYVFPLYTPGGVSVLDDFPKDHWHHRGLFWAWPVVEVNGRQFDLWMNMTARDRTVHFRVQDGGRLEAENYWKADGRDIVREELRLTAYPAKEVSREMVFELLLTALDAPVTLRGSRENGKSYGGFSARFAKGDNVVLRADGETLSKDEDLNPRHWAELEATYEGKRAVLRITPDANDPGAPYQWCIRRYGFVGGSFPGRTAASDGYTLEPGKPLRLRFRVKVSDIR